jgi:hypothetical protein
MDVTTTQYKRCDVVKMDGRTIATLLRSWKRRWNALPEAEI